MLTVDVLLKNRWNKRYLKSEVLWFGILFMTYNFVSTEPNPTEVIVCYLQTSRHSSGLLSNLNFYICSIGWPRRLDYLR